jgi:hypothetical protein
MSQPRNPVERTRRPPPSLNGADWGTSDAKHLIIQDMLDGLVPVMENIRDISRLFNEMYAHQPEFANFPFDEERYKARIKCLQSLVKRLKWAANYDKECLAEARLLYPKQSHGPTGKPLWRNSEAATKLDEDMANSLHLQMTPKELFETRECYKEFGKRRFSKRIDQKKEAAKPYGMNPMQAAARKEDPKTKRKGHNKVKNHPEHSRVGLVQPYSN